MATPSHADYVAAGGSLAEVQFLAALPEALAFVDHLIWPNIVTPETEGAYLSAVFAAIDMPPAVDGELITSERIGNTSVTYGSATERARARSAHVAQHLTGTGLLYRGL